MRLCEVKDENLWRILERLQVKTELVEMLKTFTQFNWSKDIIRLTSEIGQIKMGLTEIPGALNIWNKIQKKKKEDEKWRMKKIKELEDLQTKK